MPRGGAMGRQKSAEGIVVRRRPEACRGGIPMGCRHGLGEVLRPGKPRCANEQSGKEGHRQTSPSADSPLLSNILLDDLDKELERRGHRFCRYADDCNKLRVAPQSVKRLGGDLKAIFRRGPWWNSGASHMNACVTARMLHAQGLLSLLSTHQRFARSS